MCNVPKTSMFMAVQHRTASNQHPREILKKKDCSAFSGRGWLLSSYRNVGSSCSSRSSLSRHISRKRVNTVGDVEPKQGVSPIYLCQTFAHLCQHEKFHLVVRRLRQLRACLVRASCYIERKRGAQATCIPGNGAQQCPQVFFQRLL